jgi:Flp pilus assembly protein TadG
VRAFRKRHGADDGAAAVEFALLLPLFLIILFGVIFFGFAFNTKINLTQAARESARYGATLSLKASAPGNSGTIDTWLAKVTTVATSAGGDDLKSGTSGRYICVAYVSTSTTKSLTTGSGGPSSGSPCYDDGRSDDRVQVVVRSDAMFNGLLFGGTVTLDGQTSTHFEAVTTS